MRSKRSGFFRRVRGSLKQMRCKTHRFVSIIILLAMFLGTAVMPPTFAHIAAEKSIVQGSPNAQELVEQGRTSYEAERFNEAAKVLQQAAATFEATGNRLEQAIALSNLSLAYQKLGQWQEATGAIAQSLDLLNSGRNIGTATERTSFGGASLTLILAQALEVQGRLQLALSKAQEALTTWQQAASTYARVGDEPGVIRSRINSASALQALGLYRQADKTLTESSQLLQNQPDSHLKAIGLRNLGNVRLVIGDLEESRKFLQQSKDVATRLQSQSALADALLSLGNITRVQQDTQAALEFYRQAATASTSPSKKNQALLNQLSLLLETEQFRAARALWPQILSDISNLPASRTAVYARIDLAQSLMKLGSRGAGEQGSRGAGEQGSRGAGENKEFLSSAPLPLCTSAPLPLCTSAQLLAKAIQQAKSLEDQRAESYALGTLGGLYEQTKQWSDAIDLTQQSLLIAQTINASDIAYQWQRQLGRLLRTQGDIKGAIATYEQAVNMLQSLRSDLVANNTDVQFNFRESVEPVYREFVDLLLQSDGTSEPSQENLQKARNTIESLQIAELDNFFREACLAARVDIDKILDREEQTAAVIYPIILPERVEVILKLPRQPLRHYATSLAQSQVEKTIEELRRNLIEPDTLKEAQSLSQQVYNWLLQPAATDLAQSNVKTLVFVLDGSLRNIPMAALYDGQQYLIEKYGVALIPGLQLLAPRSLEQIQLKALTAGLSEARYGFSQLNYVKKELEQIHSEMSSQVLLNQQFTTQTFQTKINSQSFTIVHLATHGQFSSDADKTFILAWDQPIKVKQLNNLLRSRDTRQPDAIELLVLSACETATGDKRAALGLAGVAIRAGARSTLASLWNVDDESTAVLMSQFYQELANKQLTKAEALRRAQLTLLKNPQYQPPLFWAPYVLLGNWL